jgi:Transposase DDE domain
MRKDHYTLTPADIRTHAQSLCHKHIGLQDHGPVCTGSMLWTVLFYAASRMISLAGACASLRDAPSDTAMHDALLASLPETGELQRRINRALQGDLPASLRRRRQPMAIDLTLIPYHGKPLRDLSEIFRSQAKSGTTHFHAYATAYVIQKGRRFTLALTSVCRGEPLPQVIQRLLAQAARASVRPRYLLLDRGFCSVDVIRYLQAARRPFLMPLTLRGRKADHPQGPSGSRIFQYCRRSGWSRYTLTNSVGRKATVEVCVKCRNRRGERGRHGRHALVYAFGAGLRPGSYAWVKETYRLRFGIETSYRQMNQARIRTCTRDPLLRLLYVAVALILRNVWVWLHWQVLAKRRRGGRRINLGPLCFRKMLVWLQHWAEAYLGIRDELATEHSFYD